MTLTQWCIKGLYTFTTVLIFNYEISWVSTHTTFEEELELLKDYSIYYSFSKTKDVLMKYYEKSDEIKKLVDEFDFRCANSKFKFQKKFPFVTVEGAYRRSRNTVAQRLAKSIKGRVVSNPPQFMIMSNYFFNDTTELRRAFYSLGIHAAACIVKEYLTTSPVVVAGFWIDQTAFGIAKMINTLPPATSKLYQWPEDLIKPDKVYLINTASNFPPIPLHPYKPMRVYSFKDKLVETMLRFHDPGVTEINTTTNYDDIVKIIVRLINNQFNTTYTVYR